jgi:hypothetical protein
MRANGRVIFTIKMSDLPKPKSSLLLVTTSPMMWAAHFVLCYATASIWCAKVIGFGGSLTTVRTAIVLYTALALAGIGVIGLIGYHRHSLGHAALPHDDDTPKDRHRFLGFATLLLSALSAVAVIYAATVAIFIERCF